MLEAQEMFRTANKVTRPEKALILGFMAGSRGNVYEKNYTTYEEETVFKKSTLYI